MYSTNKLKNQKSHGNSKLILIRVAVNTDFGQSGRCLLRLPRIFCHTLHKTIDVVTLKNLQLFFLDTIFARLNIYTINRRTIIITLLRQFMRVKHDMLTKEVAASVKFILVR